MPVFTAAAVTHANPLIGSCFEIDILLPSASETTWVVQAYIGEDFQRSVVSRALADRLGCTVNGNQAVGELVLQSSYDGGPVIHRTPPITLQFGLAHPGIGDAYLHLSLADLQEHLGTDLLNPTGTERPFMSLKPLDPEPFCIVIPI